LNIGKNNFAESSGEDDRASNSYLKRTRRKEQQ
jgi:hypothetical protein